MSLTTLNQAIITRIMSHLQSQDAFNLSKELRVPLTSLQLVMVIQNNINELYNTPLNNYATGKKSKISDYIISINNTTASPQLDIWKDDYSNRDILIKLFLNNQSSNIDFFPLVYLRQLVMCTHYKLLTRKNGNSKWSSCDLHVERTGSGLVFIHHNWYLSFARDHIAIRTINCNNFYELVLVPSQELGSVITCSRYSLSHELRPQTTSQSLKVQCMSSRSSCNIKQIKYKAYGNSHVYPLKIKYRDGLVVFTNESYQDHLDAALVKNGSVTMVKSSNTLFVTCNAVWFSNQNLSAKTRMCHRFASNHVAIDSKNNSIIGFDKYNELATSALQKQYTGKQKPSSDILFQEWYIKLHHFIVQGNINKCHIPSTTSVGNWDTFISIIANSSSSHLTFGEHKLTCTPLANWSNVAAPVIDL